MYFLFPFDFLLVFNEQEFCQFSGDQDCVFIQVVFNCLDELCCEDSTLGVLPDSCVGVRPDKIDWIAEDNFRPHQIPPLLKSCER